MVKRERVGGGAGVVGVGVGGVFVFFGVVCAGRFPALVGCASVF